MINRQPFTRLHRQFPEFPSLALIALALGWCVMLWAGRVLISDSSQFIYILYNLVLASIPLALSTLGIRLKRSTMVAFVGLIWLGFFPNAPYLLTDLIHLRPRPDAPFWLDWMLLTSAAGTGLLVATISLNQVHRYLHDRIGGIRAGAVVVAVLALTGFGIYLGRFPRWNTWDILFRPERFWAHLTDLVLRPWDHPVMLCYSFGVALMLSIAYAAFLILPFRPGTGQELTGES